ncbi:MULTISPECIES: 4-hydroxy-tetrahydrodipicolinate reductase [Brevibacillus]|jgi:dihydrodipicolinate reductase|uniref:4-hydroxy-tetrahydrodipicolinate reductase n=1 Tax=Brevibacillus parabrevis TaxID=54914 RepID=A0A4Y3PQX7_BREPA|nr:MULTISPECIES: 4-hydroxy-tetrahydrodipicolinate reductase [Brevibacillus]MBU8712187.1 4-hydroxy-tetrahydrodipicolinate reductase [Brevibacillus parabrevis]MDH6349255.1 4-hydroxy-tetrahydrodipicolinate reductase [Brevibacillus sp. 1238]MDR5001269.1 4-hydroxy-tetrahydrodipicolinate reductase [Brevibacillus parabrevis]MED2257473.1 4-hydroxy-tetrahydrodipicolinate reductase [Brevibacillus parabrevis]NRQ52283.1 4-hydroxy-tetrahydrodipicolinate reductase [Brevibacillus sp. HD1.4A]
MNKQIRVAVAGANGRMGQEVVKMLAQDDQMIYTGNLDTRLDAEQIAKQMEEMQPDVLVDFTTPHSVYKNMELCLAHGVRPVIGTTGLTPEQLQEMTDRYKEAGLGAIIAPNFAIGAILCMKFSAMAAKYMPHVEIIELHHDRKLDAPSGTALKTAEMIAAVRQELKQGHPEEVETIPGARGAEYEGFRIHSVRLPGMVAHQEVLFGATGQTLSIRHDSINRESFMPGVNLAIKAVMSMYGLIYGLEHLID